MRVNVNLTRSDAREVNCPPVTLPRLMRVSEVDRECDPASTLAGILKWLREFISRPHPDLGRAGPICPFVPASLEMDTIWITEITDDNPSIDRISATVNQYRNIFLKTDPQNGRDAINKALLVAFPSLTSRGAEGAAIVDEVQHRLKASFVENGMMIGEFHKANESPGLRNPDFRPLRSPVPMLAIRHMVESDLPFMTRPHYTSKERAGFLRAYLFRLGGTLSQSSFDLALDGLMAAQAALSAETKLNQPMSVDHVVPCPYHTVNQAADTTR